MPAADGAGGAIPCGAGKPDAGIICITWPARGKAPALVLSAQVDLCSP